MICWESKAGQIAQLYLSWPYLIIILQNRAYIWISPINRIKHNACNRCMSARLSTSHVNIMHTEDLWKSFIVSTKNICAYAIILAHRIIFEDVEPCVPCRNTHVIFAQIDSRRVHNRVYSANMYYLFTLGMPWVKNDYKKRGYFEKWRYLEFVAQLIEVLNIKKKNSFDKTHGFFVFLIL